MIVENLAGRSEEQVNYKMREGRRLVGFALKQHPNPAVFYNTLEQPPLKQLTITAERKIAAEYTEATGEVSGAIDVLLWGMNDVTRLVIGAFTRHNGISKEEALTIATSPESLKSHALGARIPQEKADEVLFNRPGEAYDLSADHSHIAIIDETIKPSHTRGCPVVSIENGIPIGDPLFRRFADWSAQLGVEALYHHRQTPDDSDLLF
ncbi:MAG TPA: hypothetical protein VN081_00590 [Dongiaceae bacterium]|nr:hypothetical protein [Dongiaceae bacterium]